VCVCVCMCMCACVHVCMRLVQGEREMIKGLCWELDKHLEPPEEGEIYEPGSWLEEERLSPPEASSGDPGADRDGVERQT